MSYSTTDTRLAWIRLRRWLIVGAVTLGLGAILLLVIWSVFFHYVPPGKILVLVAKDGRPLPAERILAEPGEKGIQREVLGEGWQFVLPVVYETELHDMTLIKPGEVGIVTAKGGTTPADGGPLAHSLDEKGIRRDVLPPGAYRLNPHGYTIDRVPAIEIKPGYVGVLQRLLGKPGQGRFATTDDETGILRQVLQPGLYYVNTKEYRVIPSEVGVFQKTYSATQSDRSGEPAGKIVFPVRDGNSISMECTIEWEVLPEHMPKLIANYGRWQEVERNVIDQQARKIARDRGFNYGVQDFLEGTTRETFQNDFTKELEKVCREHDVEIRSAFIRNIIIPDNFLRQKRDRQLASEITLTYEAQIVTQESTNQMAEEQSRIAQRIAEVEAETMRLVAELDRQVENTVTRAEAEVDKIKAEYEAQIALLDAERQKVVGEAAARVKQLKETATNSLYKMKLDVFQGDGASYLRYALSEQLNPQLRLRLFHAGPGTFWTNLSDKGLNLMLPTGSAAPAKPAAP